MFHVLFSAKLKGSTLIFYMCENVSTTSDEAPVSLRIGTSAVNIVLLYWKCLYNRYRRLHCTS